MDDCVAYVWEFEVSASTEAEFRRQYGPNGAWVQLFRQDPAYIETLLLRDASVPGRYLTIDRWRSIGAYQSFRERNSKQYNALGKACEKLTTREACLGTFLQHASSHAA